MTLFPFGTIRDRAYVRSGLFKVIRDLRGHHQRTGLGKDRATELINYYSWVLVDCKYVLSTRQAARLVRIVATW